MTGDRCNWLLAAVIGCVALVALAWGADEPGARALHEQQMMRQQQQDTLQLRMQQQQRSLQSPPAGAREGEALERLQINQQQRQQQLHYRQNIEPPTAHPDDDAGARRTKAELERQRAQRQGERQLQRFDSELQQRVESGRGEKARGEIRPPEPPATLQ
ncbi:MAG: hypothetical protein OEP48_07650 [Betaproteobacteria bacterium]|nr:hypothetical protein [Betaproteobacteria bacterium]MDH3438701.1 hypothetical protein [Betaproteobacteria bacterium]